MADKIMAESAGAQIAPGDGVPLAVPSGQVVSLIDVIWNVPGPNGLAVRFRFLAPAIARDAGGVDAGGVDADVAGRDMDDLCQNYALHRIAEFGPQPSQIIISLSDVAVPFGEAAPDATQYFQAYSIEDGLCVWEVF